MTATARPNMPRPPKRNDIAVKVAADVVRLARTIAGFKGVPLAEIISEAARPALEKEAARIREQLPGGKK